VSQPDRAYDHPTERFPRAARSTAKKLGIDADKVVDNEDAGPAGTTGDFRLAVPFPGPCDIRFGGVDWAPGADASSSLTDVDVALGAADQTPPSAPTGLTATPHEGSIDLSWSAAADNTAVTAYAVYRWTDPTPIGGSINYTQAHVKVATVTTGTSYTDPGLLPTVLYHYEVRAADAATNVGPRSNQADQYADGTPPTAGDNHDGLWHRTFALRLSGTDSGSGIDHFEYRSGGPGSLWDTGNVVALGSNRLGNPSGARTVTYRAYDRAGNVAEASCVALIDGKAPATTCDAPSGPVAAPLTVHLTPHDADSGVSRTDYSTNYGLTWRSGTSFSLSTPGTYWVIYRSVDNVGNIERYRYRTLIVTGGSSAATRRSPNAGRPAAAGVTVAP